jgi:hypothetical protein
LLKLFRGVERNIRTFTFLQSLNAKTQAINLWPR